MTQTGGTQHDYELTFRADGGGEAAPGAAMYTAITRVRGSSARAALVLNRHNGDLIGRPVGLFAESISPQQATDIAVALNSIKWADLPRPTKGDISGSQLSLSYVQGPKLIQREFNSHNRGFIEALAPVMGCIDELDSALLAKPARAIAVTLARTDHGFKLVLRNVGTGPVMVADPRPPAGMPGANRGSVRVAEVPDGTDFAMLIWKSLELAPLGNAPPSVTLAPGGTHEIDTVAWPAPGPGNYFAQGSWKDYLGPEIDPKAVMPVIPEPDHVDDKRPYVVRGAAFSSYLKFTVDKPRR